MSKTTATTGAAKRAAAEKKAAREAAKAAEKRRAYYADLFRTDFFLHFVEGGERRILEFRDRGDAEWEARYVASLGATDIEIVPAKAGA